ncbi:Lsr2 protein [Isoptericola sp. CG 20/1183]|uniref:Lsr2 protein n=1 Tax=Isoptericola halotolerans TaxID=300560 RepID=A0ABX5EI39_9MICO|nr:MULTISPECIES: tyrosine-type recombinase/integrase [Isoptericola]PRZ09349.1 Lsr2 protein [Isoptericola sp. CG 20/1183]PRZ10150.1 Lsr2 protein [Isoptericola halotolerans]
MPTQRRNSSRRATGSVRRLPSGRWQARYTGPDDVRRTVGTYPSRADAEGALAVELAKSHRGTWRAPELGAEPLADYARRWLDRQHQLAPRTRALYERLLARWIVTPQPLPGHPTMTLDLGATELRALSVTLVTDWYAAVTVAARESATSRASRTAKVSDTQAARTWAAAAGWDTHRTGRLRWEVLDAWHDAGSPKPSSEPPGPGAGRTQAAQAYRLLRTICSGAVRERLLDHNPCQVPRAGQVHAAERVPATPAEVARIAAAMPQKYRTAVLVAAWGGLRASEVFAMERRHVEVRRDSSGAVVGAAVRVEQALVDIGGQPVTLGPPKSSAGRRTVHLPHATAVALVTHLAEWTALEQRALVFATETGRPLRAGARTKMFDRARVAAGVPHVRFHDLRHHAATLIHHTTPGRFNYR